MDDYARKVLSEPIGNPLLIEFGNQINPLLLDETITLSCFDSLLIQHLNENLIGKLGKTNHITLETQISTSKISVNYNVINGRIEDCNANLALEVARSLHVDHNFNIKIDIRTYMPVTQQSMKVEQPTAPKSSLYFDIKESCSDFSNDLREFLTGELKMESYNKEQNMKQSKALLVTFYYYNGKEEKLDDREKLQQFNGNSIWYIFKAPGVSKLPTIRSGIFWEDPNKRKLVTLNIEFKNEWKGDKLVGELKNKIESELKPYLQEFEKI